MKFSAILAAAACGLAPVAAFRLPLNHGTSTGSLTSLPSPTGPAPSSWSTASVPIPTGTGSPYPSGGFPNYPPPPFPYSSGSSSSSVATPTGTPTSAARKGGVWREHPRQIKPVQA
ncbi:hypothetical protein N7474_009468 [Penicillium riverlandense]|uniref:uncharacterized protein n=1 Tax=Penicillium riverlandense TaxID=1903569 RepID=UPI0025499BBD|nr:uncharacterized protein N7474_009468 [Penicillium riverlandense]KAJ5808199.1 hypothetical protein N7474_009468 [Penicillium riverlandense]